MAMHKGTGLMVISGSRHQRSGSRSIGTHANKSSFQSCYTSSRQRSACHLCRSLQGRRAEVKCHTSISGGDGHCHLEKGDSPASKKLSAPLPSKACLQEAISSVGVHPAKELRWVWNGVSNTQTGTGLRTRQAELIHCKAAGEPKGQPLRLL